MNVLITFYCLDGATEKLALAAAVGAVQGRAAIRLRRLDPQPGESAIEVRLDQEYVVPKEADARWADAIILGMPAQLGASSAVVNQYLGSLGSAGVQGKTGAVFVSNGTQAEGVLEAVHRAFTELGLNMLPLDLCATDSVEGARLLGRRVAELGAHSKSRVLS